MLLLFFQPCKFFPTVWSIWNSRVLKVNSVPIGYSNLGYSGRAAYSDLNPNGTWSSCIT